MVVQSLEISKSAYIFAAIVVGADGDCTILEAEARAFLLGLKLAEDLNLRSIDEIESDSLLLINSLKCVAKPLSYIGSNIVDIESYFTLVDVVWVGCNSRKCSSGAHRLFQ